jgi:hypothetical protein
VASVAALTELAALRPGDVVVVDDVLAPPSLRTIIALVGAARARAKSGSAKSFAAAAAHRL